MASVASSNVRVIMETNLSEVDDISFLLMLLIHINVISNYT